MLRPVSYEGAWNPMLGKEVGRPEIFLERVYRREFTAFVTSGDSAIRHCV